MQESLLVKGKGHVASSNKDCFVWLVFIYPQFEDIFILRPQRPQYAFIHLTRIKVSFPYNPWLGSSSTSTQMTSWSPSCSSHPSSGEGCRIICLSLSGPHPCYKWHPLDVFGQFKSTWRNHASIKALQIFQSMLTLSTGPYALSNTLSRYPLNDETDLPFAQRCVEQKGKSSSSLNGYRYKVFEKVYGPKARCKNALEKRKGFLHVNPNRELTEIT